MNELLEDARTVAVKACTECRAGLLERDKFCRWCGAAQPISMALNSAAGAPRQPGNSSALAETVAIAAGARTDVYR